MANITVSNIFDLASFVESSLVGSPFVPIDEGARNYVGINYFVSALSAETYYFFGEIASAPSDNITNSTSTIKYSSSTTSPPSDSGEITTQSDTLSYKGNGLLIGGFDDNSYVTDMVYQSKYTTKLNSKIIDSYTAELKSKLYFDAYTIDFEEGISDIGMSLNIYNMFYKGSEIDSMDSTSTSFIIDMQGDISVNSDSGDSFPIINAAIDGILTKYNFSSSEITKSGNNVIYEDTYSIYFENKEGIGYSSDINFDDENQETYFEGSFNKLKFASTYTSDSETTSFSYQSTQENKLLAEALNAAMDDFVPLIIDDTESVLSALLHEDDQITGTSSNDLLWSFDGNDSVNGLDGIDTISGGDGKDTLNGGDETDYIFGNAGNDTIDGGNDNDLLMGNDGKDVIRGSDGDDYISGGMGADSLFGGQGDDSFIFNTKSLIDSQNDSKIESADSVSGITQTKADRVMDFKTGEDRINIYIPDEADILPVRNLGDIELYESERAVLDYSQALSRANRFFNSDLTETNDLFFVRDKKNGYLFVDSDNNGKADLSIILVGVNDNSKISIDDITVSLGRYPDDLIT